MATVRLKPEHLKKIQEVFIQVVEWKAHALKESSFESFKNNWVPSFIDQFENNSWKCNREHQNTFVWISDQIKHSKRLAPGVNPKYAMPLNETLLGREVIEICKWASRGQLAYDGFARNSTFNNLFQ